MYFAVTHNSPRKPISRSVPRVEAVFSISQADFLTIVFRSKLLGLVPPVARSVSSTVHTLQLSDTPIRISTCEANLLIAPGMKLESTRMREDSNGPTDQRIQRTITDFDFGVRFILMNCMMIILETVAPHFRSVKEAHGHFRPPNALIFLGNDTQDMVRNLRVHLGGLGCDCVVVSEQTDGPIVWAVACRFDPGFKKSPTECYATTPKVQATQQPNRNFPFGARSFCHHSAKAFENGHRALLLCSHID